MTEATLTFLGSGTSMGIPTLGCRCAVCHDAIHTPGSKNRRTRPSVRITYNGHTVLIDTGPDFHAQAIRESLTQVDAVFYTHNHADHILGMDDLRPLSFRKQTPLPLFADDPTADALERVFGYTFSTENRYPTSARVAIHRLAPEPGSVTPLFGADFLRIPLLHGRERTTAYRFGSAAYLTDLSDIPEESIPFLQNLDLLILDALRHEPHPSHSTVSNSIRLSNLLKPRRTFFTHMGHDLDHATTEAGLPPNIHLAYDGLQLTFDIAPA